ncbi:O-acetylserine/cysteine efflux transporter [Bradyrhizobium arachidis]|nr:O-acetylserine/cysteine efflux transporter [Bradyrhizobium arachidis]
MDAFARGALIFGLNGLERKIAMTAIQIVCAIFVPLLWGYQFVVIKVGVTQFPPLFFLALRFLVIAVLLVPFVARPTRRQLGPVAAISLFLGGLNFGLFYVGLGLGSGSLSAVAYQLATPFTVLLAWPLLGERPSPTTSAGVALAFIGVVVLGAGPSANALPLLLVVGAAFSFAVSNVLTKRHGPFDPFMLMGWSSLLTVPQVVLMSLLLEHGQLASLVTADGRGWLALAYTIVIGGIAGFGLWFWLIARCSMSRVAPFGLLLPVFALMSSVAFLGEHLTSKLIAGALLAISGVAITQIRPGAQSALRRGTESVT